MADPDNTVGEVMDKRVIAVNVFDDKERVAMEMNKYDFLAMPVVDEKMHLVGMITFDDIFDVMTDEATEDMYLLANLDIEERGSTPVTKSVALRVPWLLINLGTAILAAYVVSLFTETISKFVALAALMPIVAGMGGNAGTQTLTLTIRGLALGQVSSSNARQLLDKELGISLLNGSLWAVVVGVVAWLWFQNVTLGYVISAALVFNMLVAALAGILVPLFLKKINLDPALSGVVVVTTITDIVGFMSFLGLATLFLL